VGSQYLVLSSEKLKLSDHGFELVGHGFVGQVGQKDE
jgi:hypothetical protein